MIKVEGYTLLDKLYESVNSIIYLAMCDKDKTRVAVKMLAKECPTPEEIARFSLEYKIGTSLKSEYLINVLSLEKCSNGLAIVMEYFEGETLSRAISSRSIKLEEFLQITIKTTQAMGAIHSKKIIYKDMNPTNILWNSSTGNLNIIDFGISTFLSSETLEVLNPIRLEGTLPYISPEQTGRMNRKIDYRSDYYSLGVTFYELLTGCKPFESNDIMEIIHSHIARKPKPPNEVNKSIPKVLSDIVLKLMSKNAEKRYQSSFGIRYDLEKCLQNLVTVGTIQDFKLGENDVTERFEISQKLYGREEERQELIHEFDISCNKAESRMVLVTGYSGAGKTSLVKEIHKPIFKKRGYFISGKQDQLSRNIPYLPFIQALEKLIKQILTQDEKEISEWRTKILDAIGSIGQVIINVIPQLEVVIGKQPEVPELLPQQAQIRFSIAFQNFIRVSASKKHPLVIFLDDLQWADIATLKLIDYIMSDPDIRYILLIGAYRENEVDAMHPLIYTIDSIKKKGKDIRILELKSMDLINIALLISDTLNSKLEKVNVLAKLCMMKTGGNPFFLNQFLRSLYEEDLIRFDLKEGVWNWDAKKIEEKGYTDNVVDLMISKIQKLPQKTQNILKLAACCGNSFELKTLSIICGKSILEINTDLFEAIKEGLILSHNTNYTLYTTDIEDPKVEYMFLHNRIHQAAYQLIEDMRKKEIHLGIGRLILENVKKDEMEEKIFFITDHLNKGIELISNNTEKQKLAKLNLRAGIKAKKSAAYNIAFNYMKTCADLLDENCWDTDYDTTLHIFVELMEIAFAIGDFDCMRISADTVLQNAKTIYDKVYAIKIFMDSLILKEAERSEVVKIAISFLEQVGVKLKTNPNVLDTVWNIIKVSFLLRGKKDNILDLPVMTNKNALAAGEILSKAFGAVFAANKPALLANIGLKAMELALKYGISPSTAMGFPSYGFIQFHKGNIDSFFKFGKLFPDILNKFNYKEHFHASTQFYYSLISHWKNHFKDSIHPFKENINKSIEEGDIFMAGLASLMVVYVSFHAGKNLEVLLKDMVAAKRFLIKTKNDILSLELKIYFQTILNLRGESENPFLLDGEILKENEFLSSTSKHASKMSITLWNFNKAYLYYLFYQYNDARIHMKKSKEYFGTIMFTYYMPLYYLYESLTYLAVYKDSTILKRKQILLNVNSNQKKMKLWAQHAPMNYLHKYYLVEAEKANVLGKYIKAEEYYNKAIELAASNEFINEEALASERAGIFYLSRANQRVATTYLLHARHCYKKWGVNAKVVHIDKTYSQLLGVVIPKEKVPSAFSNINNTVSVFKNTCTGNPGSLDLISILKSSQAISEEKIYKNLIEKLMTVAAENLGAQRILLITRKENGLAVEAECNIYSTGIKASIVESYYAENNTKNDFPASIINYVARTRETLVLEDARFKNEFEGDVYFKTNKLMSILCMPFIYQGNLNKILYAENNLSNGAFTEDRVQILKLLSAQMVISLENSKAYTHLEEIVKERTCELNQEIEERKKVQQLLLEMATHDSLTGLSNRVLFHEQLTHSLKFAKQNKAGLTILFIDLDGFKRINDTYGHESGDVVLKAVAQRLQSCLRKSDMVARLGGDEFAVIIEKMNEPLGINEICKAIIVEISKPILLGEVQEYVTASIGVSIYPYDGDDKEQLITLADNAMYIAKKAGKNKFVFNNPKFNK